MAFTPAQREAIDHDGHLLMVAGPGSGKTTTSVARALRILADPKRRLIMVTFTKEGADEMRRRLDDAHVQAGGKRFTEERLLIGTFHSIALKHLFKHRPRVKVLSPGHQSLFLREAMGANGDNGPSLDDAKVIQEEFESYMYSISRDSLLISHATRATISKYESHLASARVTDLYTVLRDCALLCDSGDIPPLPFTDMLVDEAQDTDGLQKVWIFAHARAGTKVAMVGDDDQSIYEWRQALGYDGMRSFMDTFGAYRVELGDNFRCRQEILDHAVLLIQHNKNRLSKHLVSRRGPGGRNACYHTASNDMQCTELAQLISDRPGAHQNAVVLARRNQSLNELEFHLSGLGITYTRIGKSIWDNPHVEGYLCLLQSLLDGSPVGIFGYLGLAGLDERVKTELLHWMKGSANAFLNGVLPTLESATAKDDELLKEFGKSCAYWRRQLVAGSVSEVVLDVGQWISSKQRSPKVRGLLERASSILGSLSGKLSNRLFFISNNKKQKDSAPVTLMTMHGSKGLEFTTVHIIDATKPDDGSDFTHQEAERRLMYVALTRTKDNCVVWYSGVPHPTLKEAQLPVLHKYEEVADLLA